LILLRLLDLCGPKCKSYYHILGEIEVNEDREKSTLFWRTICVAKPEESFAFVGLKSDPASIGLWPMEEIELLMEAKYGRPVPPFFSHCNYTIAESQKEQRLVYLGYFETHSKIYDH
jgi:hypothetical protein